MYSTPKSGIVAICIIQRCYQRCAGSHSVAYLSTVMTLDVKPRVFPAVICL